MKKYGILLMFVGLFVLVGAATWGSISGGDDGEVLLISPADNVIVTDANQTFVCSAEITGASGLVNLSLFSNSTGTWQLNESSGLLIHGAGDVIAYYTLDETSGTVVEDLLGNFDLTNNDAEIGVTGIKNSAYNFSDNNVTGTIKNATLNTDGYSMVVWFNPDGLPGAQNDLLVIPQVASFGGIRLAVETDGQMFFNFGNGTEGTDHSNLGPSGTVSAGNWYQVVITHNDTTERLYLNGTLLGSFDVNGQLFGQSEIIRFALPSQWSGRLDEISLWNISLTSDDVTTLYNAGTPIRFLNETPLQFFQANFTKSISDTTVWNCEVIDTDDVTAFATSNNTIFLVNISEVFNAGTFETKTEQFNITTSGFPVTISAVLQYDGVDTTATSFGGGIFSVTQDTPIGTGSKTFFWNLTSTSGFILSQNQTQNVGETTLEFCNATFTTPFINFSYFNETTAQEAVQGTIDSTWSLWLGSGVHTKSKTLVDSGETFNKTLCASPTNQTLNTNVSLSYTNSQSQQRSFSSSPILTNTTLQQNLFLLPSGLGLFQQFQARDIANNPISLVQAIITRVLNSATITVGSGFTDSSGVVLFFLDPDETYTATFSKGGFSDNIFTFVPTTDIRFVTMGGGTQVNGSNISVGLNADITPLNGSLSNNSLVTF